jgi:hypothetical protein
LIAAIALAEALAAEAGAPPVAEPVLEAPELVARQLSLPESALKRLREAARKVVAEIE